MWFSDIFCVFGGLAMTFAQGALLLDIGRFSVGLGIGIITYVVCIRNNFKKFIKIRFFSLFYHSEFILFIIFKIKNIII